MNRRVVITGMGMLTPLGSGVSHNWDNIIAGKSGIAQITNFDVSDLSCRIAGQVPRGKEDGQFDIDNVIDVKEQKKMDIFTHYALAAASEAIKHSGWAPKSDEQRNRTGVMIGSGIGGLNEIYETSISLVEKGARRVSPFFIPRSLINLASGQVSIRYGLRGPNHAVVTACATGAHAIGDAARIIMLDDADVMIAGGSEAAVCRIGIAGFAALRALSTHFNEHPTKASRPFDRDRDGFVMGEGAGVLVLEELNHALSRGAKIMAELIGYGMSGDGYHMTSPAEDGSGGFRAMSAAVKRAGIAAAEIDYVNAHGTSTPMGDSIEVNSVRRLLGDMAKDTLMSSTKSSTGHLLGAAGAIEAIWSIKAINEGIVPPTINLENIDPSCAGIDLVPNTARRKDVRIALSNSFGFGGTNASLIFKRFEG